MRSCGRLSETVRRIVASVRKKITQNVYRAYYKKQFIKQRLRKPPKRAVEKSSHILAICRPKFIKFLNTVVDLMQFSTPFPILYNMFY